MTYLLDINDKSFLYNGQFGVQTDPNGLLYMRARYYNPYISRFLNPDPSGFGGGLNFYLLCNGNPINAEDPFGLWTWGQVGSAALHFGEGVAVGAAVATVVVLAAPEIAVGGAAALVWVSAGEITAATATSISAATVTVGLAATATYGASRTAGDIVGSAEGNNWNQVAYDVGTLTGGFIVGGMGGGKGLAEGISGQPTSANPGLFGDSALGYNPNYPNGSLLIWLGSGPTHQSGTAALGLTAGSAAGYSPTGK